MQDPPLIWRVLHYHLHYWSITVEKKSRAHCMRPYAGILLQHQHSPLCKVASWISFCSLIWKLTHFTTLTTLPLSSVTLPHLCVVPVLSWNIFFKSFETQYSWFPATRQFSVSGAKGTIVETSTRGGAKGKEGEDLARICHQVTIFLSRPLK